MHAVCHCKSRNSPQFEPFFPGAAARTVATRHGSAAACDRSCRRPNQGRLKTDGCAVFSRAASFVMSAKTTSIQKSTSHPFACCPRVAKPYWYRRCSSSACIASECASVPWLALTGRLNESLCARVAPHLLPLPRSREGLIDEQAHLHHCLARSLFVRLLESRYRPIDYGRRYCDWWRLRRIHTGRHKRRAKWRRHLKRWRWDSDGRSSCKYRRNWRWQLGPNAPGVATRLRVLRRTKSLAR